MKIHLALLVMAIVAVAGSRSHAQTLNWGSLAESTLMDSTGQTIDENTFVFELGAFVGGFTPDQSNVDLWQANWQVFDRAAYSEANGYFTSSVQLLNDGTSNSLYESPMAQSFVGLEAYLWVKNDDNPVEGTEWLLTRATTWVFPVPDPGPDCCDTGVVEWSVSDLTNEIPKWGKQGDDPGPGVYTNTGSYTLQTFTFVPEPSSAALVFLAGLGMVLRRRRDH